MTQFGVRRFLIITALVLVVLASVLGGAISDRIFGYRILDRFVAPQETSFRLPSTETQRILKEESVVIEVAERVSPSVVTISIEREEVIFEPFSPLEDPFGLFRLPQPERTERVEQDVASGFIISADGLIVTNRHVVADPEVTYKVITRDDRTFEVSQIYRDPVNDLAILKIDPSTSSGQGLKPVELGDSDSLKVGQFALAIGTALGEFRHTVTTGVISGLGRGITAGSPFAGYVEQIDNVIQTDAAINPGNSGGPLLNSAGQVIGVNVAVAAAGENIGFAIPINVVKASIENFEATGRFVRPFLGIRYRMIGQEVADLNEVPQGAFVVEVVADSPAEAAGLEAGDIITHMDGEELLAEEGGLAVVINKKRVGDRVTLTVWRDGETLTLSATLTEAEG